MYLFEESLHQNGIEFELVRFDNGDDALQHLVHEPWSSLPDVVVLDLHLPGTDGQQILRVIRDESRLAGVPIVILSGASPDRALDEDLARSAVYVQKAMDVADYMENVAGAIRRVCGVPAASER